MKIKSLLLFVFGLGAWLLLTNYQVVYSKFLSFTEQSNSNTEELVSSNEVDVVDESSNLEKSGPDEDATSETETVALEENISEEKVVTPISDESSELETNDAISSAKENVGLITDDAEKNSTTDEELISESSTDDKAEQEQPSVSNQTAESAASTPSILPMHGMWMPPMHSNTYNPWANPAAMMNPMNSMMMPMMAMMGTMMNPAMYMNPMTMMNHPMNTMTHPQNMNAMMMAMDPKMMFSMFGQPSKSYQEGEVPDQLPVVTIPGFPTQTYQNWPTNKVSPGVSREAKKNAFQTAMAVSPLSMRDMMGIMADKIPVAEDVSWDDAVEAMKLRANEVNFKFVGSSPLWKEIEAVTGEPSAKVEMFRFCDAAIARRILDEVPEFVVFLPCKIALIEDGDGKLWVMTMDWDVAWLDFAQNPNSHLSKEIRTDAARIRENLQYIMEGAATGDF